MFFPSIKKWFGTSSDHLNNAKGYAKESVVALKDAGINAGLVGINLLGVGHQALDALAINGNIASEISKANATMSAAQTFANIVEPNSKITNVIDGAAKITSAATTVFGGHPLISLGANLLRAVILEPAYVKGTVINAGMTGYNAANSVTKAALSVGETGAGVGVKGLEVIDSAAVAINNIILGREYRNLQADEKIITLSLKDETSNEDWGVITDLSIYDDSLLGEL